MSGTFLGIDIGGTKTALALVELPEGRISARRTIPTPPPELSGEAFLTGVVDGAGAVGDGASA